MQASEGPQLPTEIKCLIEKMYLFKIKKDDAGSQYGPPYAVKRMMNDAVLIQKFKHLNPDKVFVRN